MQQELDAKRKLVVHKMMAIRSMKRGTINEQFVPRVSKGRATDVLRGPYYVLSRREHGRTVSVRVSGGQLQEVRADLSRFEEFKDLCEEFARLTERLGEMEREQAASAEAEKKGLKSRKRSRPK